MVLKNLENEDKNICAYFLPVMNEVGSKQYVLFQQLRAEFTEWRNINTNFYYYYNIVEKMLLGVQMEECEK